MHVRLKRTPGLYLAGFMGCGKTTVGRLLAEELGWNFIDVDAEIESMQRQTIARIFAEQGEAAFRELESRAIRARVAAIEAGDPTVVALGGGAFVVRPNWELIERNGITIWLDCPLDRIRSRLSADGVRPLAQDPLHFERLFEQRRPLYARAHYSIDAGAGDPSEIVRSILGLPIF
ncbi:MAG: shikimate kinase [Bryobacteraceae bacterium]